MKSSRKRASRNGLASVEVIMSISVFVVLALVSFWLAAEVYAAIYEMNAISSGAGLSVLLHTLGGK